MKCEIEGCTKRPLYSPLGTVAKRCSSHKLPNDVQRYIDLCEICETNTALFNFPGSKKGIRCSGHKETGMIPLRGNFCKECKITNPCYGFPGGRGTHCLNHKLEGQVNVEKKVCEIDGCEVTAKFGYGKKITRCASHKLDGMMNPFAKTCEKCNKLPSFGFEGKIATRCLEHKENEMVNSTSKRCEKCKKFATYGSPRTKLKRFCVEHAEEGMINVAATICSECDKIARYGFKDQRASFCREHKKDGMVNVKSKHCLKCEKIATFNFKEQRGAKYCAKHAEEGMISFVTLYCKTDGCMTRGYKKYDEHCYRCYVHLNPNSITTRNFKTKERAVKDFLVSKWPTSIITHDKAVDCFLYRPDFVIELGSHTIVIEVDEDQHERYDISCENKRLMSIFQGLGSRPMVMIRFNPDKYTNGNNIQVKGCWTSQGFIRNDGEWKKRLKCLEEAIVKWWDAAPGKEVAIEYLFYTNLTGV